MNRMHQRRTARVPGLVLNAATAALLSLCLSSCVSSKIDLLDCQQIIQRCVAFGELGHEFYSFGRVWEGGSVSFVGLGSHHDSLYIERTDNQSIHVFSNSKEGLLTIDISQSATPPFGVVVKKKYKESVDGPWQRTDSMYVYCSSNKIVGYRFPYEPLSLRKKNDRIIVAGDRDLEWHFDHSGVFYGGYSSNCDGNVILDATVGDTILNVEGGGCSVLPTFIVAVLEDDLLTMYDCSCVVSTEDIRKVANLGVSDILRQKRDTEILDLARSVLERSRIANCVAIESYRVIRH